MIQIKLYSAPVKHLRMSSKEDNPGAKLFQGRLLKGDNYLCGKVDIHYDLHHSSSFYGHMFWLLKIESAVCLI